MDDRRRLDWILLNTAAVAGRNINATTATATDCTRHGQTIEASLSLSHPPHPSTLFVHSPDMNPREPPTVVRTAEDLLLVSVTMTGIGPAHHNRDYFVYRAHTTRPSIQRLELPAGDPYFNRVDGIGLLPRPDGQYTLAALIPTALALNQYRLHVFDSGTQSWSCKALSVEAPQDPFPIRLPRRSTQLHTHLTGGVITVGGEGGTIGWVDHWRGILFCDVLRENPCLRGVPIPLPLKELSWCELNGEEFPFGPGWARRGISFSRDEQGKGVLKLVHLEVTATRLRYKDPETKAFAFKVDGWSLTTWSNRGMSSSYEDWRQDCKVHASDITIDDPAVSHVLQSGLLMQNHNNNGDDGVVAAVAGENHCLALQNVATAQPAHCMHGKEDVICLMATKKHRYPVGWILTVDMKNAKLQAVEEFCTTERQIGSVAYYPSMISKYLRMDPPTTLGCSFPISSKETPVRYMQPNEVHRIWLSKLVQKLGPRPRGFRQRGFAPQPGSTGGDDAEERND